MNNTVLSLQGIGKTYPGVVALNGVSIDFESGSVHAVIGENGAGKSTLIKCVSGAETPNTGKIVIGNKSYAKMTPKSSEENGIAVIYQETNLVQSMTVGENVFLGREPRHGMLLDRATMNKKAYELLESIGIKIDPNTIVGALSPAKMQMVEIAKALSQDVRIMIMDEPTSAITNSEIAELFRVVRELKAKGVCIVYISHRLNEIFELSDKVTIMRDGKIVGHYNTKDMDRKQLINLMAGRELGSVYPERHENFGEVVFEAQNVWGNDDRDISLKVRKGEILGLGGLVGAGRSEFAMLVMGMRKTLHGKMIFCGKEFNASNPNDAIELGIGMVSEDRRQLSIMQNLSVKWNMTMANIRKLSTLGVINRKKENESVSIYKDALRIKTSSLDQRVAELSGGNQQKVAISKWLATDSKMVIFDEPTKGIDVGTRYEIYKLMFELAEKGMAIIMISSDMEELLGVSDRIMVFAENQVAGELQKKDFSQQAVLELASMTMQKETVLK